MKKKWTKRILGVAVLAFVLCLCGYGAQQVWAVQTVEEGTESGLDMKVLTGETWRTMSPDAKIAFVWGVGHVVSLERELMHKYPESLNVENFSHKTSQALAGMPIDNIVRQIDKYYERHPGQLDRPVMAVIWQQMVRPKVASGICGKPWKSE
jgi:hypothetical protein